MFFPSILDPFFLVPLTRLWLFSWKIQFCDWSYTRADLALDDRKIEGFRSQWVWRCCVITSFKFRANVVKSQRGVSLPFYSPPQNTLCLPLLHWFVSLPWLEESAFFGKGACVCVYVCVICLFVVLCYSNSPQFPFSPPQEEDLNRSAAGTSGADSHGEGPIWVSVSIRPIQSVVFLHLPL